MDYKMYLLRNLIQRLKKLIKSKWFLSLLFSGSLYLILKRRVPVQYIQLSAFLQGRFNKSALNYNLVEQIHVSGKQVWYKQFNNEAIYQTDCSMMSKDKLFSLLENKKNLAFDCQAPKSNESLLMQISISYVLGFLAFKLYEVFFELEIFFPLTQNVPRFSDDPQI